MRVYVRACVLFVLNIVVVMIRMVRTPQHKKEEDATTTQHKKRIKTYNIYIHIYIPNLHLHTDTTHAHACHTNRPHSSDPKLSIVLYTISLVILTTRKWTNSNMVG